ncbi:MAG: hypothetical protein ACYTEQ_25555, partial [Planctomycetota bacterium]
MKKLARWTIVSAAGLALMSVSHFCCQRMPGATDPSQEGIIYVGKGDPNSQTGEFKFTKGSVLLLSL